MRVRCHGDHQCCSISRSHLVEERQIEMIVLVVVQSARGKIGEGDLGQIGQPVRAGELEDLRSI